jgi:hypothetical protein
MRINKTYTDLKDCTFVPFVNVTKYYCIFRGQGKIKMKKITMSIKGYLMFRKNGY